MTNTELVPGRDLLHANPLVERLYKYYSKKSCAGDSVMASSASILRDDGDDIVERFSVTDRGVKP